MDRFGGVMITRTRGSISHGPEGYAALPGSYSLPFGARAICKCTLPRLCLFMIDTHDLDLGSFTCSDTGGARGREETGARVLKEEGRKTARKGRRKERDGS